MVVYDQMKSSECNESGDAFCEEKWKILNQVQDDALFYTLSVIPVYVKLKITVITVDEGVYL